MMKRTEVFLQTDDKAAWQYVTYLTTQQGGYVRATNLYYYFYYVGWWREEV